jgi:hypothetical protein
MSIVDGDMVVFKYYGRHKQWWHYSVEDMERVQFMIGLEKGVK